MASKALFFYGTLRDPETLAAVLGPYADQPKVTPGQLRDVAVMAVRNEDYPIALPSPGEVGDGIVVEGLGEDAIERLAFFEDEFDYGLEPRRIETEDGHVIADVFIARDARFETDGPWDFEHWSRTYQPHFCRAAVELMDYFGVVPMEECDLVWQGIRGRVLADLRAQADVARPFGAGPFDRSDVRVDALARPYQRFFGLEEMSLAPATYSGAKPDVQHRTAFLAADAVTVLPWDPVRDEVMVAEQFRAAVFARGDQHPWVVEAIAGRIDGVETPASAARREALEEGGVEVKRLAEVAAYYPSTGTLTEHVTSFIGEVDLSGAGGTFGVVHEGEDIRAFTIPLHEAVDAANIGKWRDAPLLISLLWLQANADRLRREWRVRKPA